jgi:hypothetical protein
MMYAALPIKKSRQKTHEHVILIEIIIDELIRAEWGLRWGSLCLQSWWWLLLINDGHVTVTIPLAINI